MKSSVDYGVYKNLPFEKYKQLPGINQSAIKLLLPDFSKKRKSYINNNALQFGNAGHCLLLEPEKFMNLYICAPKNLRIRKKNGKKQWKEFSDLHKDKIVLTYGDWSRLQNIKKYFQIHPKIRKIFSNGDSEVSLFWYDQEYNLDCKARLDWFDEESKIIADLKFTKNISKEKIHKTISKSFAIQADWYIRGVYQLTKIVSDFLFIFIEKYPPHTIQIIPISKDEIKLGHKKIDYIIHNFKKL